MNAYTLALPQIGLVGNNHTTTTAAHNPPGVRGKLSVGGAQGRRHGVAQGVELRPIGRPYRAIFCDVMASTNRPMQCKNNMRVCSQT